MKKARVLEDHAPVHAQVLVGVAGERLQLGRRDDEWPGWIWCENAAGVGSWVPEPYLAIEGEEARLLEDYDATELTVRPGDLLVLHHEVLGWWWVTDEARAERGEGNQGWVPALKLALK